MILRIIIGAIGITNEECIAKSHTKGCSKSFEHPFLLSFKRNQRHRRYQNHHR